MALFCKLRLHWLCPGWRQGDEGGVFVPLAAECGCVCHEADR